MVCKIFFIVVDGEICFLVMQALRRGISVKTTSKPLLACSLRRDQLASVVTHLFEVARSAIFILTAEAPGRCRRIRKTMKKCDVRFGETNWPVTLRTVGRLLMRQPAKTQGQKSTMSGNTKWINSFFHPSFFRHYESLAVKS